ncbi:uncharacterized protein LOC143732578 isoform X2 [Siphateles boraxobius]|uniref:uncharacterized protein LOC143732578 isoform X2 n=1 Tax=Siphateles boraxobius TaxID=180520 RepID=UPI004062D1FE
MMLIFGLTLLLKTAACVEFNCSFLQSKPCSAVLGDKLSLQLMDARGYNDLKIQKINYNTQDDPVCRIRNDRIKEYECDLFNNRAVSFINGILIINPVIRADSGIYRLRVYNSDGTETSTADLLVIVEGKDPLVVPIILGCLAVVLIILVIVAYYFYRKKNQLKPTTSVSERVNEHVSQKKPHRDEEQKTPEYATVISQNERKKKKEEVHYGEVTFTSSSAPRPRQTHEDCVYSEVQTHTR